MALRQLNRFCLPQPDSTSAILESPFALRKKRFRYFRGAKGDTDFPLNAKRIICGIKQEWASLLQKPGPLGCDSLITLHTLNVGCVTAFAPGAELSAIDRLPWPLLHRSVAPRWIRWRLASEGDEFRCERSSLQWCKRFLLRAESQEASGRP